jgi:hypothetical protein
LSALTRIKRKLGSVEKKEDLFASMKWEGSIVLLVARILANAFAVVSLLTLLVRWPLARYKKTYYPWMADAYVILLLAGLVSALILGGRSNVNFCLVLFAAYVLIDATGSVVRDVIISPPTYNDENGLYISIYDGPRWLVLAFLNVIEVVLCFAVFFLYYGQQFCPVIDEPITAIYFSFVTFISLGYGDIKPIYASTRTLVCCEILSFILFLAIRVPAAVSIFRVKEEPTGPKRTPENEVGENQDSRQ